MMSLIFVTAIGFQAAAANIADLAWMSGCWTLSSGTRTITEFWLPPAGGSMLGMSRTVSTGKTIAYEFIVLRAAAPGLEYVARPSGQTEAIFTSTKISSSEAVFENPAHDFPTRITYRRSRSGLTATIDGVIDGKHRVVDFAYTAGTCTP